MVEAPQLMPSINGFNKVATNSDGSTDLWFGPQKPGDVPESNWIQTVEGRNFLVALRLYGTGVEFFDQTWKPADVVKIGSGGRALQQLAQGGGRWQAGKQVVGSRHTRSWRPDGGGVWDLNFPFHRRARAPSSSSARATQSFDRTMAHRSLGSSAIPFNLRSAICRRTGRILPR
jgi:hypothetical protein